MRSAQEEEQAGAAQSNASLAKGIAGRLDAGHATQRLIKT
jgi:hypothetical protein